MPVCYRNVSIMFQNGDELKQAETTTKGAYCVNTGCVSKMPCSLFTHSERSAGHSERSAGHSERIAGSFRAKRRSFQANRRVIPSEARNLLQVLSQFSKKVPFPPCIFFAVFIPWYTVI
jgi:hypothetical protein